MSLLDETTQTPTDLTPIARRLVSLLESVHRPGNDSIEEQVLIVDLGLIRKWLQGHLTDDQFLGTLLYARTTQRPATAAAMPTTPSTGAARAARRTSPVEETAPPTRRSSTNKQSWTTFRLEDSSDEEDSTPKKTKTIKDDDGDGDDSELEDVETEDVNLGVDGYDTAEEDERKPAAQPRGALLRTVEGSHEGEPIELIEGSKEVLVIGKNPKTQMGENTVVISDEDDFDLVEQAATVQEDEVIDVDLLEGAAQPHEVIDVDLSEDEVEAMEVEENRKPVASQKRRGALLRIVGGPHEGESIELIEGTDKKIIIGKKPKGRRGAKKMSLSKDGALDDSHVKLVLSSSKHLPCQVLVVDLESSTGTFVRGIKLPSGKDYMASTGDSICFGSTILKVCSLAPLTDGEDNPAVASSTTTNRRRKSRAPETGIAPVAAKENVPSDKPYMILKITDGPYKGECIDVKLGMRLCVGTEPTKQGIGIPFPLDKRLNKNHARFEMKVLSYSSMAVEVMALDGDVWVNDKKVPKKGTIMAFGGATIVMGSMVMVLKMS